MKPTVPGVLRDVRPDLADAAVQGRGESGVHRRELAVHEAREPDDVALAVDLAQLDEVLVPVALARGRAGRAPRSKRSSTRPSRIRAA